MSRNSDRLTEDDVIAHAARNGLELDPTLTVRPPPSALAPETPEGVLLARVRQCALANGFLFYHTYSSRKSDVGYVDCTIAKPGHPLYLWELKSQDGKLTMEQQRWQEFLSLTRGTHVAVYRPDQWALMEHYLTRHIP
jgi:hypothetical protein